jgi:hypothetical protein
MRQISLDLASKHAVSSKAVFAVPASTNRRVWTAVALGGALALGACTTVTDESRAPQAPKVPRAASADPTLLDRLDASNADIASVAAQIAKTGDTALMKRASQTLISIAESMGAKDWRDQHRGEFKAQKASPKALSDDRLFEAELVSWQIERLTPVYAAMDVLGGDSILDFVLREASDRTQPIERRLLAIAVLEHHVDRTDSLRAPAVASLETELDKLRRESDSDMPEADAGKIVAALTPMIHDCVKKAIETKPGLETKGVLTLSMNADGTASQSNVTGLEPTELAKCVEDAGRKVNIGATSVGVPFTLRIPMNFHPK